MDVEHLAVLILALVNLWLITVATLQDIIKGTATTASKIWAVTSTTFCTFTIIYILKGLT